MTYFITFLVVNAEDINLNWKWSLNLFLNLP